MPVAQDDLRTWDSAWSSLPADRLQLFTRQAPRTLYQFWQKCYVDDLWPLVERSGGAGRYLEVGAGRGTTSMYLASRGCDVTLLDYAPAGLAVARANFRREELPSPRTVIADARATGLQSGQYDCVFSMGLLEHFDDPLPVLQEMLRVIKPGGWLYALIVPDRPPSARLLAEALFAPWRLAPRLLPAGVRRTLKRMLGRGSDTDLVPLRTGLGAKDYVSMLAGEAASNIQCVAYNPYHEVYRSKFAERWILVPAYRLHHALRTRFVRPSGRTAACALERCKPER